MSKQKQTHRYREQTRGLCIEGAVVLENTLESPLDSKKTKPVNPKGNQS